MEKGCITLKFEGFSPNSVPAPAQLQKAASSGDNRVVKNAARRDVPELQGGNPFQSGTMVVVTLGNPREKFWGVMLSLGLEGVCLCGIELASFEDLISMVKEGEAVSPGIVFFPTHRMERMELDLPDGNISSLSQRFAAKTGHEAVSVLMPRNMEVGKQ